MALLKSVIKVKIFMIHCVLKRLQKDCRVQNMSLRHKYYFEMKSFENKLLFPLNSFYLPKSRDPQKNSTVVKFPGMYNQGRWTHHSYEKLEPHLYRHCHKTVPVICSPGGPFIFPKVTCFPRSALSSPLLPLLRFISPRL